MTAAVACAAHRERVMDALASLPSGEQARLVVLGAGPAEDMDLHALARRFAEIHLVDRDSHAVRRGIRAQLGEDDEGIHVHTVNLREQGDAGGDRLPALNGTADVVVSACVLSQLVDQAEHVVGASLAERSQHIDQMVALLRPHGHGVLLTDVVSSATAPCLWQAAQDNLAPLMRDLIQSRNFFTGLNPYALHEALQRDPRVATLGTVGPWLWDQRPGQRYLVVGLTFSRRGD